jgi:hypothetical protein
MQARLEREKRDRLSQRATFQADFKAAAAEHDAAAALVRRLKLEQQVRLLWCSAVCKTRWRMPVHATAFGFGA